MELNNNELLKRIEIPDGEDTFTTISDNLLTKTSLLVNKLLSLGKIDLDEVPINYWTDWNEIDFILYENNCAVKTTFYIKEDEYLIVKVDVNNIINSIKQLNYNSIEEIDFEEIFTELK